MGPQVHKSTLCWPVLLWWERVAVARLHRPFGVPKSLAITNLYSRKHCCVVLSAQLSPQCASILCTSNVVRRGYVSFRDEHHSERDGLVGNAEQNKLKVGESRTSDTECIAKSVIRGNLITLSDESLQEIESLGKMVEKGDRGALARAITLVESTRSDEKMKAEELLSWMMKRKKASRQIGSRSVDGEKGKEYRSNMELLDNCSSESVNDSYSSNTLSEEGKQPFRIGISGSPGAGKSTFIETLGLSLVSRGYKVAVLAVDPSSVLTGGSILGDKTRMVLLSRSTNAFIRPSPSRGTLGGVARATNGVIALCEGAGYDVILVETVGVGQSEVAVHSMVDMLCILVPPASGDDLQALKRGIVEMADGVIVTKSDGDLLPAARRAAVAYRGVLKFLTPKSPHWTPKVLLASSKSGEGINTVWDYMKKYRSIAQQTGTLYERRAEQRSRWMWDEVRADLTKVFRAQQDITAISESLEQRVKAGELSPGYAAQILLDTFYKSLRKSD